MDKHKKFHHALLKIYFPPPPLTMLDSQDPVAEAEPVEVAHMEAQLDFDPGMKWKKIPNDAYGNITLTKLLFWKAELEHMENGCCSNASDPVTQKLTRAQRKRIKKRKLKEAASTRRKIIGPLPPPGYKDKNQLSLPNGSISG